MGKFPTKHILKIGIVVRDIEKAANAYAALFDIPVPQVNQPVIRKQEPGGKVPGSVFRGKTEVALIKTAVIKLEPICIELIEPLPGLSPWSEFLEKKGPGVFFMAFEETGGFADVEKFMAEKGMPIYHKTEKGFQRYGYFETAEQLGITVEYKEVDK